MLAVVIPTLNTAAASLPACLGALAEAPFPVEVLLANGGGTAAPIPGARVLTTPRGRGAQIAAGVAATTAPWLLLLHDDTVLAPGWSAAAARFMAEQPEGAAYFRLRFDDTSRAARRVERLAAWRCRRLRLPYGDQGLLVSRATLAAVGGVRPLPLMEDVDLIRRLVRAGRPLVGLEVAALTSAARYRRDGWWARPLRNLSILTLWACGVAPSRLARWYG
ncbi:GT2 family glycosyltransferase [Humitalea rosea]|uniref:GT2 family glycosyltransferase n=2 Tax=Humitalea rosea TaxID=990373 RepID=A0A2W7IM64_9PROT|nr:GT2 family glycosyltransferase [Humitalea rosea]